MNILCTNLYETKLKNILEKFAKDDIESTKKFKLYLDTIILNMPTKAKKYKTSIYFDNENIRDIEHERFIIPFYIDDKNDNYLILSIIER